MHISNQLLIFDQIFTNEFYAQITCDLKLNNELNVQQGSVTTGDGLEIPLNESILPPILPPIVPIQAPSDVNNSECNNSVINDEKPKEPEFLVIKLSSVSMNPSSFVCNKLSKIQQSKFYACEKSFFAHFARLFLAAKPTIQQGNSTRKYQTAVEWNNYWYREERANHQRRNSGKFKRE